MNSQLNVLIRASLASSVLLLAACGSEPTKPEEPAPTPVAATEPAPGSQAEAEAVAAEAAPAEPEAVPESGVVAGDPVPDPSAAATPSDEQRKYDGPTATASTVQPPVWIYRGSQSTALLPGTAIYEGDRIETGRDGRVQLAHADGGRLNLGGSSVAVFTKFGANEVSTLNGSVAVKQGPFTYASGSGAELLAGDFDFKLGKLTAALTQGEIAGRADASPMVCLVSGKADAIFESQPPVTLDQPNSCASKSAGGGGQIKQIQQDAQIAVGSAVSAKGTWSLVFISEKSEDAAKQHARKLWKAGYPAEVFQTKIKNVDYFRVVLRGFDSRTAAAGYKKRAADLGFKSAWANANK